MIKVFLKCFFIVPVFIYGCAWANLSENPTLPVKIHLQNGEDKIVRLLRMKLSPTQRIMLSHHVSFMLHQPKNFSKKPTDLPLYVENGMNGVPVLDQGEWGTCATFSTTAVIDAAYGLRGQNLLSQLCNLELGRTLQNPDEDGGWEGSFGYLVLQQIAQYGYLPKSFESSRMCGGLSSYPTYDWDNGNAMSVDIFTQNSIKKFSEQDWKPIVAYKDFKPLTPNVGEKALDEVKHYLAKGNRILFGMILDSRPGQGQAGAIGKYNQVKNDTWVLTDSIRQDIDADLMGGHELIITGYDDRACAEFETEQNDEIEPIVQKQCGILHLRNSWSVFAGDWGDYYMTYDYFKTMAIEVYAILAKN